MATLVISRVLFFFAIMDSFKMPRRQGAVDGKSSRSRMVADKDPIGGSHELLVILHLRLLSE
jgi:hypothetical protein